VCFLPTENRSNALRFRWGKSGIVLAGGGRRATVGAESRLMAAEPAVGVGTSVLFDFHRDCYLLSSSCRFLCGNDWDGIYLGRRNEGHHLRWEGRPRLRQDLGGGAAEEADAVDQEDAAVRQKGRAPGHLGGAATAG
jgi:hypothetical protein